MTGGDREVIMRMFWDGDSNLESYEVIGTVLNVMGAGPKFVADIFFYDWQGLSSNEFALRKLTY